MPASTTRGLPYPLPTEPVAEGAQAIRNLAEAVDAKVPQHIATTKLAAAAASIIFTAIPQTFKHLLILADLSSVANNAGIDDVMLRINASTAGVYTSQWGYADGTAFVAAEAINAPWAPIGYCPDSTVGAGARGSLRLHLTQYSEPNAYKSWISQSFAPGPNRVANHGGVFALSQAISRVDIIAQRANLSAGSVASLYGFVG